MIPAGHVRIYSVTDVSVAPEVPVVKRTATGLDTITTLDWVWFRLLTSATATWAADAGVVPAMSCVASARATPTSNAHLHGTNALLRLTVDWAYFTRSIYRPPSRSEFIGLEWDLRPAGPGPGAGGLLLLAALPELLHLVRIGFGHAVTQNVLVLALPLRLDPGYSRSLPAVSW